MSPLNSSPDGAPDKKPLSEAQLAANRQNAQKSTGPKTPEGKATVRYNAAKHYGYCHDPLIPGESMDDYEKFAYSLATCLGHKNTLEFTFVDNLICELWCWQRFNQWESNIYVFTPDQGFLLDEMDKLTRIKVRRWKLIERIYAQLNQVKDRFTRAKALGELMQMAHEVYGQIQRGEITPDQVEPSLGLPEDPQAQIMTDMEYDTFPPATKYKSPRRTKTETSGGYDKMLDMLLGLIRKPNARIADIIQDRIKRRPAALREHHIEVFEALLDQECDDPQA